VLKRALGDIPTGLSLPNKGFVVIKQGCPKNPFLSPKLFELA